VKVLSDAKNVPGYVILLNLVGVFQLILNNESDECMKIRNIISKKYLPNTKNLKLYK